MATLARLLYRPSGNALLNYEKNIMLLMRPVTIKASKAPVKCDENYDVKNMKLSRPYSPHLTIYAPQLTSMMSITHRGTGMILSGFAMILGIGALLPDNGLICLIDFVHDNSFLNFITKFGLAFPFAFHFTNGIRHLMWDLGKFLTIKQVYLTGYGILAVAGLLGGYLALN